MLLIGIEKVCIPFPTPDFEDFEVIVIQERF